MDESTHGWDNQLFGTHRIFVQNSKTINDVKVRITLKPDVELAHQKTRPILLQFERLVLMETNHLQKKWHLENMKKYRRAILYHPL